MSVVRKTVRTVEHSMTVFEDVEDCGPDSIFDAMMLLILSRRFLSRRTFACFVSSIASSRASFGASFGARPNRRLIAGAALAKTAILAS